MNDLIFSEEAERIDWFDVPNYDMLFGTKGAISLLIPRAWTLPFVLLSAASVASLLQLKSLKALHGEAGLNRIAALADAAESLIVRSSVVAESIWDRGTCESPVVSLAGMRAKTDELMTAAALQAVASANGRPTGLMIQRYMNPVAQGEFGNVLRVSKTRDHWEIATREQDGGTGYIRLNSQRDRSADPRQPLLARAGLSKERLFGSIAAWMNNELLRGQTKRLNCEWLTDNRQFYIVQIDEEDEDISGVNPLQLATPRIIPSTAASGCFLKKADPAVIDDWDKLLVLKQLWEPDATHKPSLFYVPVQNLPSNNDPEQLRALTEDFNHLIGASGIVVRTSVRAGNEKLPNLPRTECLDDEAAARWCLDQAGKLGSQHPEQEFAFVAHRFVASKAGAWVRAEPNNPHVQINALWGLPDALGYCPYDIWEVHVPADVAVAYPEYKSHMLLPCSDGSWEHVRVKNDIARLSSVSSGEAKNIASRSAQIAERLGKACHIMWFVGCLDGNDTPFNMPWYWTEAHHAERNTEFSSYSIFSVSNQTSLDKFSTYKVHRGRPQALALEPNDPNLMRDNSFIASVAAVASANRVPVILYGSTLAHAYYQLRKQGCVVLTPNEKAYARVRKSVNLGKLVRDKIPEKIARRQELTTTQQVSGNVKKGFLISKLFEEAIEVREAATPEQKVEELGDIFEILREIAASEGIAIQDVEAAADLKRQRAGGFEEGLVLLQTGIAAIDGNFNESERALSAFPTPTNDDTLEIPFTFIGFAGLDQLRSVYLNELGLRLDITLRNDRIELKVVENPKQLSLALDGD